MVRPRRDGSAFRASSTANSSAGAMLSAEVSVLTRWSRESAAGPVSSSNGLASRRVLEWLRNRRTTSPRSASDRPSAPTRRRRNSVLRGARRSPRTVSTRWPRWDGATNPDPRTTARSISATRPLNVRSNRSAGASPSPSPSVSIGATRLQATSTGTSSDAARCLMTATVRTARWSRTLSHRLRSTRSRSVKGSPATRASRTNRWTRSNHRHGSDSGPSSQTSVSSSALTPTGGPPWLTKKADAMTRSDRPWTSTARTLSLPKSSSASSGAERPLTARKRPTGLSVENPSPSSR